MCTPSCTAQVCLGRTSWPVIRSVASASASSPRTTQTRSRASCSSTPRLRRNPRDPLCRRKGPPPTLLAASRSSCPSPLVSAPPARSGNSNAGGTSCGVSEWDSGQRCAGGLGQQHGRRVHAGWGLSPGSRIPARLRRQAPLRCDRRPPPGARMNEQSTLLGLSTSSAQDVVAGAAHIDLPCRSDRRRDYCPGHSRRRGRRKDGRAAAPLNGRASKRRGVSASHHNWLRTQKRPSQSL
jgi:hypothetical protein